MTTLAVVAIWLLFVFGLHSFGVWLQNRIWNRMLRELPPRDE